MGEPRHHRVRVTGLPLWLDAERLLGPGPWQLTEGERATVQAEAELSREPAADVQARLRRLGIGGERIEVEVQPPLPRSVVRAARTADARRRRHTTPGWLKREARAAAEGRFSLTPQALADAMAREARGRAVVDVCAGAGGNTVAFARAGCPVVAFEPDPERREELRHNLHVYGVASRVTVRSEPLEEVAGGLAGDLLFADPPWGEDYDRLRCSVADLSLLPVVLSALKGFREAWLKLPPSFDVGELQHQRLRALFGEAEGDFRRVKFLWLTLAGKSAL